MRTQVKLGCASPIALEQPPLRITFVTLTLAAHGAPTPSTLIRKRNS